MPDTKLENFQRLLIAIDGSGPSKWAIEVGKRLAAQLQAQVMLVHVIEPLNIADMSSIDVLEAAQKRQGQSLLLAARSSFPNEISVQTKLLSGLAADEIIAAARTWGADLIVMGTRGHGRVAQLILGSTAQAVLHSAPCPAILVAHAPSCTAEESWAGVGSDSADPVAAHNVDEV